MKTYIIAVCDDDTSIHDLITRTVIDAFSACGAAAEISCFDSAEAITAAMREQCFDMILLDIELPGEDGIALGEHLLNEKSAPDVIYVSSREDRVFDAFRARPFGFVRKSRFMQDIPQVITAYVAARPDKSSRFFTVHDHSRTLSVPVDDIMYFEGSRKNQLVYVVGRQQPITVTLSMKQLEDDFSGRGFLRVHSGFLVNFRYIRRLDADDITLTDDRRLPISRRKLGEIKLRYMELLQQDGNRIY